MNSLDVTMTNNGTDTAVTDLKKETATDTISTGNNERNLEEAGLDIEKFNDRKNGSFYVEENEQLIVQVNKPENKDENNHLLQTTVDNDVDVKSKPLEVPDGGYGWLVVFCSFMVHFIIGGIERSAGLLYLQFIDRYNQSATATAWLCAIASGIRLMLGPLTGALSNRFSCRAVVMLGGIITCVSMVITGFSPNFYFQFFSFGVLGGIGRSFAYCPAVVIVGFYFNKKRGKAVGIATSGVGAGTFVIPPLIEVVFNHYGFVGAFIIIGGISLNLTVFGILMRPLSAHRRIEAIQIRKKEHLISANVTMHVPPKPKRRDDNLYDSIDFTVPVLKEHQIMSKNSSFSNFTKRISSAVSFTKRKPKNETEDKPKKKLFEFSLLKDLRFACFCVAILLFTLAFQSAFVFLPPYVKQIGGSDSKAAFSIVITGVLDGLGRICAGFILDLEHIKPYRPYIYNGIMFLVGGISMIIPAMDSFVQLAIVCGFYGILIGVYIAQKSVIIVDLLGPDKLNFSFGIMILFQGIGTMIGPTVGGILKDMNGKYDYAFYFGGVAMVAGALILFSANAIHWIRSRKYI